MTKPNTTGLRNQTPNKFNWPVWFPYPSSWLKAFVLALFLRIISFVFTNTGKFGYKIAYFTNSPELLMVFAILAIISPIFVITYTHHIFHTIISQFFPKIQALEIGNPKGLIPGIVSIWEGLYGWLVIWLSTLISCLVLIIVFPISNLNFPQSFEFYTDLEKIIVAIIICIWIFAGALFYQVDFLFKRRLLSISSSGTHNQENNLTSPPNIQTHAKTDHLDSVNLEMDKLRGSMGLTQMKSGNKSPTTSQVFNDLTADDNLQKAAKLAKNAAQLTRIAKTKAEWYQVGIEWHKTIEMLKNVPISHHNYAVAQHKIIDYQKYINYAQKIVNSKNISN
ncbi:hypothetical protein ACSQ6I_00305 [Anabaena sp. WFMT]|uniref:hypothetical protein n=1 Tax=Anabaena sp. WFMT TaxID=3449730 RepID=UPI003F25A147